MSLTKRIGMIFSIMIMLFLVGCNTARDDYTYFIASLQSVDVNALNDARQGFLDGLALEGFVVGENLVFVYYNAQGDMSNAHMMAANIVEQEPDLILGIATPTSQALANATSTIPIVITAVTSPYRAGLVESNERPNTNVTGTTDMNPVEYQFELLRLLVPHAQNVAIIYNVGEINTIIQADIAEATATAMGLNLERMGVSSIADVMQAAEAVAGRVDVIYTPTCNIVSPGMPSIVRAALDNNIPVIAGEAGGVAHGALATVGIDYYLLGKQAARMAAQILRGESIPQEMPIQSQSEYSFVVNTMIADMLGIAIPDEILNNAQIISE